MWQPGVRSNIMPGLFTLLVQKLNVCTVVLHHGGEADGSRDAAA